MSTPLLNRRRMMMQVAGGGGPIFLEKIMFPYGTSAHIPLCRTLGDTFELRYIIGGDQRGLINQFWHSEGYIDLSSYNYVRKVVLKEFETTSQDREGTNLWSDADNQLFIIGNNYRTMYYISESQYQLKQYTAQQGLAISEIWFYASNTILHTWCKRIEVYENGVLVETFLPATNGTVTGFYSDVQRVIYPL